MQATGVPTLDHFFVIVMENHSYSQIIGSSAAPYINSLAGAGGLATNYTGVAHPSLPNYLSLAGGSTYGITSDCTTCWVSAPNIADNLESAGSSWKAYMESMPSACYVGDSYPYAQKHNPFIYFNDIRTNSTRCQSHVVPYSQLGNDLRSTSTTPNYAFITPNMCNDMHDCSVGTGDSWLQQQVPAILGSPAFKTQRSVLAITWDEDDFSGTNQVPLIMLGSGLGAGTQSAVAYSHYSLLHTIELSRGSQTLTANDAGAAPISDLFSTPPPLTDPCTSATLSGAPASRAAIGATVVFTAGSTGCTSPLYQFWILAPGASAWTIAQPYSTSSTFSWNTTGKASGVYHFSVWTRDATSSGTSCNSLGCSDAYVPGFAYTLGSPPCSSLTAAAAPVSSSAPGTGVTVTGSASGCGSPMYQFWMLAPGSGTWSIAQPYSSSATFNWNTTGKAVGTYRLSAWARDSGSTGTSCNSLGCNDSYVPGFVYTLSTTPCTLPTASLSPVSPQVSGTTVTISAGASCGANAQYQFWILAPGSTTWTKAQAYSTNATFSWRTVGLPAGTYRYSVWVRNASSGGTTSTSIGSFDAFVPGTAYALT